MTLPTAAELADVARDAMIRSGVKPDKFAGAVPVISPVNGARIASVNWADPADVDAAVGRAAGFPAPVEAVLRVVAGSADPGAEHHVLADRSCSPRGLQGPARLLPQARRLRAA